MIGSLLLFAKEGADQDPWIFKYVVIALVGGILIVAVVDSIRNAIKEWYDERRSRKSDQ